MGASPSSGLLIAVEWGWAMSVRKIYFLTDGEKAMALLKNDLCGKWERRRQVESCLGEAMCVLLDGLP